MKPNGDFRIKGWIRNRHVAGNIRSVTVRWNKSPEWTTQPLIVYDYSYSGEFSGNINMPETINGNVKFGILEFSLLDILLILAMA